jgi:phosphate transport system protein
MSRDRYFSNSYSGQIKDLVRLILRIKLYTSKVLRITASIVNNYDDVKKDKILELSIQITSLITELEDSVNKIIALSHPVAFDLRFLLFSIKLSSELYYITHWSKKTVNIIENFNKNNIILQTNQEDLNKMIQISFNTLKDVISLLLQFDSKKRADAEILFKIEKMLKVDDDVDFIYEKILQDCLQFVHQKDVNPVVVFDTIGIAKNLEKISDCIHNMIVTTKYILTGKRT